VLGTVRRWADQSRSVIAASRGGGNRSNTGLLGLFKTKRTFLFKSCRRACRNEIIAYAVAN